MTHEQLVEEIVELTYNKLVLLFATEVDPDKRRAFGIALLNDTLTTTAQRVRKETIEEIHKAFIEEFKGAGELWFPYVSVYDTHNLTEEDLLAPVDNHWESILSTLNK